MCFFPIMFEHDFEHADHWSTYSTGTPGSDRCHHLKRWWDSFLEDDKNSYKNHGGNSETNHPLKNGGTLDLQGVPTLGPVENPPWDQETSFTFTATVRRDSGGGPLKLGLRWTKDQGNLNAPRYRWAMKKPGLVGLYGGIYTTQLYSFFFFFRGSGVFFSFFSGAYFWGKGNKNKRMLFSDVGEKYLFQDLYSVDGGFDQVPNGCSSLPKKQISILNVMKSVVLWYHNFEPLSNSPHVQRCSIGLAPNCQTQ